MSQTFRAAAWGLCLALFISPHALAAPNDPVLTIEAGVHTAAIRQLVVTPGEQYVVTVSDDKTARLWSLASHELKAVLRVPIGAGKVGSLYAAAVAPAGDEVAVAGVSGDAQSGAEHRIDFFNLKTAEFSRSIDALAGDIKHLLWTPDGQHLIASYGGANGFRVFDRRGRVVFEKKFTGASYGAAVSSTGQLAVPAFDASIHFFQITASGIQPTGQAKLPIADPVSVSFSPDGKHLAVGYESRNGSGHVQLDVLSAASLEIAKTFRFTDVPTGNLRHVAWAQDGATLYAGGSGYRGKNQFLLKQVAWPSGSTQELELATNSIAALTPLAGGRLAFATAEPSWGVVDTAKMAYKQPRSLSRAKDARSLNINADATVVSWQPLEKSAATIVFDLNRQDFALPGQKLLNMRSVDTFSVLPAIDPKNWEDHKEPAINGNLVKNLATEEVSRAVAVLPDRSAVVLGTSWRVLKLNKAGQELWRVPVSTEVAALNVSQDSQTVVVALRDGSVHWLRASNGATLLTLFVSGPYWTLVAASGHYTASMGADHLMGWHVNRAGGLGADLYSVSRFRDRFYSPERVSQALRVDVADVVSTTSLPLSVRELPPTLTLASAKEVTAEAPTLTVDFSALTPAGGLLNNASDWAWQVRVNGRPVDALKIQPPGVADGKALGHITLARPPETATVQVFAQNRLGVSEPLTVYAKRQAPDRPPNLYVLAIGVSEYADKTINLKFAAKDAQSMVEMLKKQSGGHYNSVTVETLTNQNATQEKITEKLLWLRNAGQAGDVSILFIAGHGLPKNNHYQFIPYDYFMKNAKTISDEQIINTLSNIKSRTFLFMDSCFSGKTVEALVNKLADPESGVVVFASSTGSQESLESDTWESGAFTKELVTGFSGAADFACQGIITNHGLNKYVSPAVKKLTGDLQTPVMAPPNALDYPLAKYKINPACQINK
jgi:hypothetical protein